MAHPIRHAAQLADEELPITDVEISDTQVILRVDATLVPFRDGVTREAWLAWCSDRETGNEVFMAVVHSAHKPRLYPTPPPALSKAAPPKALSKAGGPPPKAPVAAPCGLGYTSAKASTAPPPRDLRRRIVPSHTGLFLGTMSVWNGKLEA